MATRRLAKPRPVQGEQAPSPGGPPRSRVRRSSLRGTGSLDGWSPSTGSGLQACYGKSPGNGAFSIPPEPSFSSREGVSESLPHPIDICPYRNIITCVARIATTADVFNAVAEPRRRLILDALVGGELAVNDLVDRLELPQPQVSKHLRVLREVGAVEVRERRTAAALPGERPSARAHPRLGEGLRARVVATIRATGRRAGGPQGKGEGRWR